MRAPATHTYDTLTCVHKKPTHRGQHVRQTAGNVTAVAVLVVLIPRAYKRLQCHKPAQRTARTMRRRT
eukprot:338937-Pelagomonas_calceolata.AAC.3